MSLGMNESELESQEAMRSRSKAIEVFKEIALDPKLSRDERLDAQARILAVSLTDRDSAIAALADLAHKAHSPSERLNAQDYLNRIMALDLQDALR